MQAHGHGTRATDGAGDGAEIGGVVGATSGDSIDRDAGSSTDWNQGRNRGALATPVATDDSKKFPLANLQRYVLDRVQFVVGGST